MKREIKKRFALRLRKLLLTGMNRKNAFYLVTQEAECTERTLYNWASSFGVDIH